MHVTDTKQKLLSTMLLLASRDGLDSVSLSTLAKETGITKASIFSHFSSREELVDEMFRYGDAIGKNEEISFEGDAETVLSRAVRHWLSYFTTEPMSDFYRIICQAKYTNEEARKRAISIDNMFHAQTQAVLETLSESGKLSIPEIDLATLLFSQAVKHFIDDEVLTGDTEEDWMIDRLIRKFCVLFS